MGYRLAAELVVLLHLGFVLLVVFGALLGLRWRWWPLLHIPAALWGAATELFGLICPLTPLEQRLWQLAGEAGYSGSFVAQYLLPVLYPAELTRELQLVLGAAVVLLNVALYAWVWRRRAR